MNTYHFQGIDFNYHCEGDGFPVLFLHGLGGDSRQCREILANVSGFHKVVMDTRGHGETHPTGPTNQLTFAQFAQDARDIMQHLGYEQFVVGGISMGSAIALHLAIASPESVSALVLIRPAWLNEPGPPNLKYHVWIGELLRDHLPAEARQIFLESDEYKQLKAQTPAVAGSLLGLFDVHDVRARSLCLTQIPLSVPFEKVENLPGIDVDTLILGTEQDPVHPFSMAEKLANWMRKARLVRITSKSENADMYLKESSHHIRAFLQAVT